jgi:hypothetical protein
MSGNRITQLYDTCNSRSDWGTLYRTIGTKDAAVARLGAKERFKANAFVEELTGVGRHRFALGKAANRAH